MAMGEWNGEEDKAGQSHFVTRTISGPRRTTLYPPHDISTDFGYHSRRLVIISYYLHG
jgi:hypothetical protein